MALDSFMRILLRYLGTVVTLQLSAAAAVAVAQAPASAPKGQAAIHACSLVSEADIQRVTGTTNRMNTPPFRADTPSGGTQCNYVGLDIALTPGVNAQNFETNRKSATQQRDTTAEPLGGVGDEAYYYVRTRSSSSNVGVVFRVGTHQVALGDRVPSDSVEKFKPKIVELAKIAAAKLR
jgi:hypothetical protein